MTEATQDMQEQPVQDELVTLKARADMMGIAYHPSIGIDKLRIKVLNAQQGIVEEDYKELIVSPNTGVRIVAEETEAEIRTRQVNEATALVRIRLSCMNPAKKEWDGEIFTTGNDAVGSIKKFVPFNAEEGWHVPNIMLQMIKDRQCQVFTTEKTKNGVSIRKGRLIKEFAIEILPQLTQLDLNEMARRQAMAAGAEA